jgi:hypothetical protein
MFCGLGKGHYRATFQFWSIIGQEICVEAPLRILSTVPVYNAIKIPEVLNCILLAVSFVCIT